MSLQIFSILLIKPSYNNGLELREEIENLGSEKAIIIVSILVLISIVVFAFQFWKLK